MFTITLLFIACVINAENQLWFEFPFAASAPTDGDIRPLQMIAHEATRLHGVTIHVENPIRRYDVGTFNLQLAFEEFHSSPLIYEFTDDRLHLVPQWSETAKFQNTKEIFDKEKVIVLVWNGHGDDSTFLQVIFNPYDAFERFKSLPKPLRDEERYVCIKSYAVNEVASKKGKCKFNKYVHFNFGDQESSTDILFTAVSKALTQDGFGSIYKTTNSNMSPELRIHLNQIERSDPRPFIICMGFSMGPPRFLQKKVVDILNAFNNVHIINAGLHRESINIEERFARFQKEPFDKLFPKCDINIHNGGAGSTVTALQAGKLQLFCKPAATTIAVDKAVYFKKLKDEGVIPKLADMKCENLVDSIQEIFNGGVDAKKIKHLKELVESENGMEKALQKIQLVNECKEEDVEKCI